MRRQWHPRRLADSIDEAGLPTVHRFGPYRFYFYADENRETREPPHVHIKSADGAATFWPSPVSFRDAQRYNPREIERIRRIVVTNRELLLRRWHEFFDHLA